MPNIIRGNDLADRVVNSVWRTKIVPTFSSCRSPILMKILDSLAFLALPFNMVHPRQGPIWVQIKSRLYQPDHTGH